MPEFIDLSLLKGTAEQRSYVSNSLLHTLKIRGVAQLKNHGLPEDLISEMFDYVC
jgi:isopenicillin N synthase-like dioxygenase